MGRRRQKIKLPIEVNNLLQQVKEVRIRGVWRKQLKNDLAVIEMYEDYIEKAYKPLVHKEDTSDWEKKSDEKYRERLIELVPERRENFKTVVHGIFQCSRTVNMKVSFQNQNCSRHTEGN